MVTGLVDTGHTDMWTSGPVQKQINGHWKMDGVNGVMVKRTGGQMDRWTGASVDSWAGGQVNMLRVGKVDG